jgi:hypothetical protein
VNVDLRVEKSVISSKLLVKEILKLLSTSNETHSEVIFD